MIKITLSSLCGEYRVRQSELSRMTDIRANTISELYRNFTDRVSLDQLDILCDFFGCELTDLLKREPNEKPRVSYTVADFVEDRDRDKKK